MLIAAARGRYGILDIEKVISKGIEATEIIEATDTYLNIAAIIIKRISAMIACKGLIAKNTPNVVATPLPPLNFKNTEKVCPRNTAKAMRLTKRGEFNPEELPKIYSANRVIKKPLSTSPKRVIIPAALPTVLPTLVAPILPLPTVLGSGAPSILATTMPVGTEPKIYAAMINKMFSICIKSLP